MKTPEQTNVHPGSLSEKTSDFGLNQSLLFFTLAQISIVSFHNVIGYCPVYRKVALMANFAPCL